MTPENNSEYQPEIFRRNRYPFFIWVLLAGLFIFAFENGMRLFGAVRDWSWLVNLGIYPGPLYILLSGGIFAVGFFLAALTLLLRFRGAAWLVRAVVVLYAVWFWIDRLTLTRSPIYLTNQVFAIAATLVLVIFALASVQVLQETDAR